MKVRSESQVVALLNRPSGCPIPRLELRRGGWDPPGPIQSMVVVSALPFINLFTKVVNIVAPEFFDNGEPGLEAGEATHTYILIDKL